MRLSSVHSRATSNCMSRAQVEGLQAALAAKDRRIEDLRSAEAASDAQCQALQEQQKVRRPGVAVLLHSTAPSHAVAISYLKACRGSCRPDWVALMCAAVVCLGSCYA
jgi:hypothetical protein